MNELEQFQALVMNTNGDLSDLEQGYYLQCIEIGTDLRWPGSKVIQEANVRVACWRVRAKQLGVKS